MRSFVLAPALSLLAVTTSAQSLDSFSFGHNGRISPNGRGIPGWHVSSQGHSPQLLSDRIVLTPPVPGNTRGALWTDNPIPAKDWTVDFSFRASGPDQASGNLQLWLVKDKNPIGYDSVYTVENFDGLAILIDQNGQHGGSIRAFLNDGSQNFRQHANIDALAFGHCDYSYRNLGRPSNLKITSQNGLTVSVDDKPCFSTGSVDLPSNYFMGMTAATADNPDSFEIYKFAVSSPQGSQQASHQKGPAIQNQAPPRGGPRGGPGNSGRHENLNILPGSPEFIPDTQAEDIKSQSEQFADLHNRIQGLTHQLADMYALFDALGRKIDERHQELAGSIVQQGTPQGMRDSIDRVERKVEGMETTVNRILKDVESKDYRVHLNDLRESVEGVRSGVREHLPKTVGDSKLLIPFISSFVLNVVLMINLAVVSASSPKMGTFIGIIVAVQILLAAAYVVYKRRRANAPKKYL